jgi:hypothetical protein
MIANHPYIRDDAKGWRKELAKKATLRFVPQRLLGQSKTTLLTLFS